MLLRNEFEEIARQVRDEIALADQAMGAYVTLDRPLPFNRNHDQVKAFPAIETDRVIGWRGRRSPSLTRLSVEAYPPGPKFPARIVCRPPSQNFYNF